MAGLDPAIHHATPARTSSQIGIGSPRAAGVRAPDKRNSVMAGLLDFLGIAPFDNKGRYFGDTAADLSPRIQEGLLQGTRIADLAAPSRILRHALQDDPGSDPRNLAEQE